MSELNREQIVKALERCIKNYRGKVTDFKKLCEALGLIEGLTEENERLSKEVDRLSQVVLYHDSITEMEVAEAKADTVRKMQERLKHKIEDLEYSVKIQRKTVSVDTLLEQGNWLIHEVVPDAIDQIAKEMLEEET